MQISTYENEDMIFSFDIQDSFIILIILEHNRGSIICKACNETYRPDQLKQITIGHGRSPFETTDQQKGGIFRNLFKRRKIKSMGMLGGRGYE